MSCVKRVNGYKIKLESGRLLPKVYSTLKLCQIRVAQLKSHSKDKNNGKNKK